MRIIAFIEEAGPIRRILSCIGEPTEPPRRDSFGVNSGILWEMQSLAGNRVTFARVEPRFVVLMGV